MITINKLKNQIKILGQKVKAYKKDDQITHCIKELSLLVKFGKLCSEIAVYRTLSKNDHADERNILYIKSPQDIKDLSKETEEIIYKSMGKNNRFLGSIGITNYDSDHWESHKLKDLEIKINTEIKKTQEESEKLYRELKNKIEDKIYTLTEKAEKIESKEKNQSHYDKISGKETEFFKIQKDNEKRKEL